MISHPVKQQQKKKNIARQGKNIIFTFLNQTKKMVVATLDEKEITKMSHFVTEQKRIVAKAGSTINSGEKNTV